MKKSQERRLIVIVCLLTSIVVGLFTVSQGPTILNDSNGYVAEGKTSDDIGIADVEKYKVINTLEREDRFLFSVYENEFLSESEIASMIDILKDKNEGMDDYKIYLFKSESDAKNFNLNDINEEDIEVVIETDGKSNVFMRTYTYDIEDINIEEPEYTLMEINNVDGNEEKAIIEIILEGDYSPQDALGRIKTIGSEIRRSNNTFYLLNIIAYTSEDKSEYWEYNGTNKNMIIYNQILNLV